MSHGKKMKKVSNAVEGDGAIKFFTFYGRYTFKEGSKKNVFY